MVTGWAGERTLEITSPRGRRIVEADAVVLATGARERPRPARLIPGDRPDGDLHHRASCRTSSTFSTRRWAAAPSSSAPNWSAGRPC